MISRLIVLFVFMCGFFSNLLAGDFRIHVVQNATEKHAVCNDGSPAVYYFREGSGSGKKNWLIYLAGGGFCYSVDSCNERQSKTPELMTSLDKPATLRLQGILSSSKDKNPDFYNANQVVVPYCSSDLWSGDRKASSDTGGYEFRGRRIVRAVVDEVKSRGEISSAKRVLLAGTSAGGIGVMVHTDWLRAKLPDVTVKGLNDAGFFPHLPLSFAPGYDQYFDQAVLFWNGKPDRTCAKANPDSLSRCYLNTAYPYVRSPLMVQMSQHDKVVLNALGVDSPLDFSDRVIAEILAKEVRHSLSSVPAAFSPRTFTHGLLHDAKFRKIKIDGNSLRDLVGNWFFDKHGPIKEIE